MGLGFLLSLSAFFSGSETALFSLSKIQVERLRQGTGKGSTIVARLLDTPRRLLITILVGNMFVNVASASLVASLAITLLGNKGAGAAVAVGVTTILLLPVLKTDLPAEKTAEGCDKLFYATAGNW
jgi:putative hemolysin